MSTRCTIVSLDLPETSYVHLYDDTWEGPPDCVTLSLGGEAIAGFAATPANVTVSIRAKIWDALVDAVIARRAEDARLRAAQAAREAACPGHVWGQSALVAALNPAAAQRCEHCYAARPVST